MKATILVMVPIEVDDTQDPSRVASVVDRVRELVDGAVLAAGIRAGRPRGLIVPIEGARVFVALEGFAGHVESEASREQ